MGGCDSGLELEDHGQMEGTAAPSHLGRQFGDTRTGLPHSRPESWVVVDRRAHITGDIVKTQRFVSSTQAVPSLLRRRSF